MGGDLNRMRRTAVVGGGAAGFFVAINLKEMMPEMDVTIFERSQRVLAKVEVSGGGRCNCTNSFESVKDLAAVYPRGHRLMKRLFHVFDHRDAYQWFVSHGVELTTQDDGCVFPVTQDSHTIIHCFLTAASQHGIHIRKGHRITDYEELAEYDAVVVTTGGSPTGAGLQWLQTLGHRIEPPVPSLFTFSIPDVQLRKLMGTVVENSTVFLPGTKWRVSGPLLVTHWGLSGPAILKLSSYAARLLKEQAYQMPLAVNWVSLSEAEVADELQCVAIAHGQQQLLSYRPFGIPQRLWGYLLGKVMPGLEHKRWVELSKKDFNRITNILINDSYSISGKGSFKDEFVTCGGVSLKSINPSTLESRIVPHLYFAGEVLDIDGITGGFNFQAAWTTAYQVASSIANRR